MDVGDLGPDAPTPGRRLFALGQLSATLGAIEVMARKGIQPIDLLGRHATGDWGDLDESDVVANESALQHGGRIFSVYGSGSDRLYVITEDDRSLTTILLPEEY